MGRNQITRNEQGGACSPPADIDIPLFFLRGNPGFL